MSARSAALGTTTAVEPHAGDRRRLERWPLDRHAGFAYVVAWVLGVGVFSALGLVLVHLLEHSAIVRTDLAVARWFVEERTPTRTSWSRWTSMSADTLTKVVVVSVLSLVFVAVWRRFREAILLVSTMLLEVSVFAVTSLIVERERPPVERLDGALPTGSYPSGHTAAAVALWTVLAIIVCWHSRRTLVRVAAWVVAVLMGAAVATARLYRGMHHVSDVLMGVVVGWSAVLVCLLVLRAAVARNLHHGEGLAPEPEPTPTPTTGAAR